MTSIPLINRPDFVPPKSARAKYVWEREQILTVELEDKGYAEYKFLSEDIVYIIDIYVDRQHRDQGLATVMADEVCDVARKQDCKQVLGSVDANLKTATESMKVLLAYGMELSHVNGNMIYFKKDL